MAARPRSADADPRTYRGRFAPSPTGPLHFGSLIAAIASYLQARARRGEWLVRMEDLDRPREQPGAADAILRTLERYGLEWDGPVMYQSTRDPAYQAALETLEREEAVYACACSRKDILAAVGDGPRIYPGTCRKGLPAGRKPRAVRVLTDSSVVAFEDLLQGPITQNLEQEVGDFVLRRADGLFAYQLAVVVDDAEQNITEVVRGSDLLSSTTRQIHLQRLLNLPVPEYVHVPVAVNDRGQKLSKQTRAPALTDDPRDAARAWWSALHFLGQEPPAELQQATAADIRQWALAHWDIQGVPRAPSLPPPIHLFSTD